MCVSISNRRPSQRRNQFGAKNVPGDSTLSESSVGVILVHAMKDTVTAQSSPGHYPVVKPRKPPQRFWLPGIAVIIAIFVVAVRMADSDSVDSRLKQWTYLNHARHQREPQTAREILRRAGLRWVFSGRPTREETKQKSEEHLNLLIKEGVLARDTFWINGRSQMTATKDLIYALRDVGLTNEPLALEWPSSPQVILITHAENMEIISCIMHDLDSQPYRGPTFK